MSKPSSKTYASKGLTLVEVIASIALLSSLLVMLLSIHSRHVRQINQAFEKQQSAELLDELLGGWFSNDEPFPANQNGVFADHPEFFWTAEPTPTIASNPAWQASTIRVQVLARRNNKPLVSVDLIAKREIQPEQYRSELR